jgi:hypothetical protein
MDPKQLNRVEKFSLDSPPEKGHIRVGFGFTAQKQTGRGKHIC